MEWRLSESIISGECCEFYKKNRPITSKDIIQVAVRARTILSADARSDLWRRTEIGVLLQQQQQYSTGSEAFYFEYVRTKICFRRSNLIEGCW